MRGGDERSGIGVKEEGKGREENDGKGF